MPTVRPVIRSVTFDLVTLRERNQRFASHGGAMAAAGRAKRARATAREVLAKTFGAPPGLFITPAGAAPSYTQANPITVRMWRIGPGWLDSDGPDDALKNARDGVADWLGIDDRNAGVDWPRGMQEKTPPVSAQAPCHLCPSPSGVMCNLTYPGKMAKGLHIARRTPWRVRIEVQDTAPGPDRTVVLASEPQIPSRKKKNGRKASAPKPDGDPGEELAARLLVACPRCFQPIGEPCMGGFVLGEMLHGVHLDRAAAAGINGILARPTRAPAPRTGVRKVVQPRPRPEPVGQGRLALQQCYARLPFEQAPCGACEGSGRLRQDLVWPVPGMSGGHCPVCSGTGTRGMKLAHEDRVDGLRPPLSMAYTVPQEHRARWGTTITLHRRPLKSRELGTIWIYDTKGQ